jgi:hypothetical protein
MPHRTSRLPSPALVVAVCALLVALGGTTYAVAAIPKHSVGAAQLKKGAVSSKAVKNSSLKAKDLKAGVLPPSEVFLKTSSSDATDVAAVIPIGPDTVIATMALPAGTFFVQAHGYAINTHVTQLADLRCYLRTTGNALATGTTGLLLPVEPNAGTNSNRGRFNLDAAYTFAGPGVVTVECNKGAAAQTVKVGASFSALRVAQVTPVS